jgi:hypothetical protein
METTASAPNVASAFESMASTNSASPESLSTILSTCGKISAYCERKSDQTIFAIYLALSTSERVRMN